MARPTRSRTRNISLGPLVQHKPPSPRPGRNHTATSRKQTHNNTKESGLNKPPQNPGLDTCLVSLLARVSRCGLGRLRAEHGVHDAARPLSACSGRVRGNRTQHVRPTNGKYTRHRRRHPSHPDASAFKTSAASPRVPADSAAAHGSAQASSPDVTRRWLCLPSQLRFTLPQGR